MAINPTLISNLPVLVKHGIPPSGIWTEEQLTAIAADIKGVGPDVVYNTIQYIESLTPDTIITTCDYILIEFGPRVKHSIVIKSMKPNTGIYLQNIIDAIINSPVTITHLRHDMFMYSPKDKRSNKRHITGLILRAA